MSLDSFQERRANAIRSGISRFFRSFIAFIRSVFIAISSFFVSVSAFLLFRISGYGKLTEKSFREIHRDRGAYGEYLLYLKLSGIPGKWLINVYFDRGEGKTAEVDAIFISRDGVFVFESKNYSGRVSGSCDARRWALFVKAGRKSKRFKYYFENPIMQNRLHTRCVKEILSPLYSLPVYSVVVFSRNCRLSVYGESGENAAVTTLSGLRKTVRRFMRDTPPTDIDIEAVYKTLSEASVRSQNVKEKHIEDLSSSHGGERYCKVCGAKMTVRVAKTGKNAGSRFWGCSNFPDCRYTSPL